MDDSINILAKEIEVLTGIDVRNLIDVGLLHPSEAKKWLIRKRYYQMADGSRTYTDIKYELSLAYGMSVSSIEKLIYRNPKMVYHKRKRVDGGLKKAINIKDEP